MAELSLFDKFATQVSTYVSRAWFFAACVITVLLWAPSFYLFSNVDTWQLIINTLTTIVTFLLVALLQNTQKRADASTQIKLNAIAAGLDEVMGQFVSDPRVSISQDVRAALRASVGLEDRQGSQEC
jgi:low affinity Fe/Cu permease